jgi:diguanylate cyclase (GGDEF)-like protein
MGERRDGLRTRPTHGLAGETRARIEEASVRRLRWIAVGLAAFQFGIHRPSEGVVPPFHPWIMGAAVIAGIVLVNLLSLVGDRAARSERTMNRFGAAQLVADSALVLAIVWFFSHEVESALWALLVVPVLEGALRLQLRGALLVWATTSFAYVLRSIWAAETYAQVELAVESVTYRTGIILIVALGCGFFARSMLDEAEIAQSAQQESERRAGLLRAVAEATRAIATPDPGSVLGTVADTAIEIGFDGVEIALLDERQGTYAVTHPRGLPAEYVGGTRPADSGLVGLVRRERRTQVVSDYSAWEQGVSQVQALGFRAVAGAPIWCAGELSAVLVAGKLGCDELDPDEVEALGLLAAQAGAGLTNAQRFTERRAFEAELEHRAFHDPLTGLPNRLLFLDRLEHCLERKVRDPLPIAVLFVDLDRFKKVNDSLGHDAGDRLLRIATERIRRAVREADLIFRMGGDEFTVLLENVRGPEEASGVAQRVLDAIAEPVQLEHHEISVTASVGIAMYPKDDVVEERLVKSADTAMYRAKDLGRNRYAFFAPEMNERVEQQMKMEAALRQALKNGEFVLHYQPRVSVLSGRASGVEALLRWRHPAWGLIEPARFVPVLEETGLIVPVGAWVLAEACLQAKRWQVAERPPVRVSVNLSPRQFRSEGLVKTVGEALRASGLPATLLELELTESLLVENVEHAMDVLHKLKALGASISIDDFGTGYSSLAYLKRFPIDSLKMDRSFVRDLGSSAKDASIADAVCALARSLDIGLVAEGVEHPWQAEYVCARHCTELQGFLFSRPLPAEEIPAALALTYAVPRAIAASAAIHSGVSLRQGTR